MVRAVAESTPAFDEACAPEAAAVTCRHCGLAVPTGDAFCCFGCELAAQIALEGRQDQSRLQGTLTFATLLTMSVMMLSLFLYAGDIYDAGADAGLVWLRTFYRWASAVLATPVMLLCGLPLAQRAWQRAREGRASMDLLITSGAFAAYGLSVWNVLAGREAVYFESATAALVLATLGRYLEARARAEASLLLGPSLELAARPVARWQDGGWNEVSPALLVAGDRFRVMLESVVPVDARLIGDPVEVNVSVLTGESRPITVGEGERVPAGAMIVGGTFEGVATCSTRQSTLERLARMAASLREQPVQLMRLADRFANVLVPAVWLLAGGTLVLWWWSSSPTEGVVTGLAVVLAACPCVYGVAAPMVLWLALRKALRHGVLVRNAAILEELAAVKTVAFDKTGTLTQLSAQIVEITDGIEREEILALVAALEAKTAHPVGRALLTLAEDVAPASIAARRLRVGAGTEARDSAGRSLWLGRSDENGTVVLNRSDRRLARFSIAEEIVDGAEIAVRSLGKLGLSSVLLSGDQPDRVESVAKRLGVAGTGRLSPEGKLAGLGALSHPVAMVGDGLNDIPALAAHGPSFAVGGGADLARGIAGISLLDPDLGLVPWTIELARRAVTLARRLLIISTLYNLTFLALAASGALRPVFAGLSMLLSSLLSIGAALRVSTWEGPSREDAS